MFNKLFINKAIARSAENGMDRRRLFRAAGAAGLGAGAVGVLGAVPALAQGEGGGPSDAAILNFALNLEYLEAEFYLKAVTGQGLPDGSIGGKGYVGDVTGGRKVAFETKAVRQYAEEIAADERAHVDFLRKALGGAAVARPEIDIDAAFTAAARAAGLIQPGQKFDAYANEENFLLAAYVFEDVGVTAYKGAAPLVDNATFLDAAAGLLAVEAYHAGNIRTLLYSKGLQAPSVAVSDARDSLDGDIDLDQGVVDSSGRANIVPTDGNGLAFGRSAAQVLNVVYLTPKQATSGGFFPAGVNGSINESGANA
ncbi:ferritin-like domain-containing protein [Streptomonospora wellingtoniae]|uniref:Ferritin-like domain-containing protein n=1 Tax=Streptomonospora wellingtoniae TaxID=3075544 RepID=A0ABU2KRM6_9ACTN|nr:ferritin-like domain-containing protein [Streptomonospora sp. DSM 45055]MDT0301871.1 ferritin-like domain-containing protein [Streptomonospora sp. DSM 45055]